MLNRCRDFLIENLRNHLCKFFIITGKLPWGCHTVKLVEILLNLADLVRSFDDFWMLRSVKFEHCFELGTLFKELLFKRCTGILVATAQAD